jgi:hypothetical protein
MLLGKYAFTELDNNPYNIGRFSKNYALNQIMPLEGMPLESFYCNLVLI